MRFCQEMQLARTRRVLDERQAEIERAAKLKHKYELHNRARKLRFTPQQMAIAIRVAEKLELSA